jgi:FkbM family methyltransferase
MQLLIADVLQPGDTVIDVGANRGNFALAASHIVGSSGRVICFEPNPKAAEILEDELRLNEIANVILHRCGLSDNKCELSLIVPLINPGEGSFGGSRYEENSTFKVPVCCGDDIVLNELSTLIKIDVEGFETYAVRGLSRTIERWSPVVITEVSSFYLHRSGSSVDELKRIFERLGYRGFNLHLKKGEAGYRWCLGEFDPSNTCDVVWLNTELARHRAILQRAMGTQMASQKLD